MERVPSELSSTTLAATLAGPAWAQQSVTLVAAVGANLNHLPSFVGVEKGSSLKHGIDLKLKSYERKSR